MILQRYIAQTVIGSILLAIFLILGVDVLFGFVRELKFVGVADYSTVAVFQYIALTLPRRVYNMFPMACLLGSLMGLGILASNSELIVMRSVGMSLGRIAWSVLKVGIILALLLALVGEFVVPKSELAADIFRATARGRGQAVMTGEGAWLKDSSRFIHIGQVLPDSKMRDILQYEFDEGQLLSVSFSEEAAYMNEQWQLFNTNITHIFPDHSETETRAQMSWDTDISPDLLTVLVVSPDELSISGLYRYSRYLQDNNLDERAYSLEYWKKILQPLSTLVMIFLAVPFIFGPLRSANMGLKIVAGVVSGFSFYILNEFFGPLSIVYQFPPLLAAMLPILLFAGLGYYLLHRAY